MSRKPLCIVCQATPSRHALVCADCTSSFERTLAEVPYLVDPKSKHFRPALLDELLTSRTRQTRISATNIGRSSAETPVPFDDRARRATDKLIGALGGWARVVLEDQAALEGPTCETCRHRSCQEIRTLRAGQLLTPSGSGIARFLLTHVEWIRQQAWADEAIGEITEAIRYAKKVIDREPERYYTGPCLTILRTFEDASAEQCQEEIWPTKGAESVTCPACGTVWDAKLRREWLLGEAKDTLATAARIADGLRDLIPGSGLTSSMVRNYADRGRIVAHAWEDPMREGGHKRPLYRVGDVIEVVQQTIDERARREQAKAEQEAKRARKMSA